MATSLRISLEVWQTRTNRSSVHILADGVNSAWARHAWVRFLSRWWYFKASNYRISGVLRKTCADRMMFLYATVSVYSTRTRTWISAPIANTRLVICTILVHNAFIAVTASRACWIASHSVWTSAHGVSFWCYDTLCARAARVRYTRTGGFQTTAAVRIPNESIPAVTLLLVIGDVAVGINATRAGTTKCGHLRHFTVSKRISYGSYWTDADWFS